MTGYQYW